MRRREFIRLFGGAAAAWPLAANAQEPEKPPKMNSIGDLAIASRDAADRGAAKLVSLIGPSGKFVYLYDAATGKVSAGYNVLRHAGSLWSILRVKSDLKDTDKQVVLQSFRWLRDRTRVSGKDQRNLIEGGTIKLGADGLALLAIVELLRSGLDPDASAEWEAVADGLANGIIGQIEPDGRDFRHKVSLATGKPLPFRSNYYTGEALFGILSWYRLRREKGLDTEQWHNTPLERVFQQKIKENFTTPSPGAGWAYPARAATAEAAPRPVRRARARRRSG